MKTNLTLERLSLKYLLPAVLIVLGFLFFKRILFADSSRVITIDYSTSLEGKVTGVNRARGYKVYINDLKEAYSLDQFLNPAIGGNDALGYYIAPGDSVSKKAHSDTLKLFRGGVISKWYLEP